jgi:hypothetical protein
MAEDIVDPVWEEGGYRCPPGYVMDVDGKCRRAATTNFAQGGTVDRGIESPGDSGAAGGDAGGGDAGAAGTAE